MYDFAVSEIPLFALIPHNPLSAEAVANNTRGETDTNSMVPDEYYDYLEQVGAGSLINTYDPNTICSWLFNIKKIYITELDEKNNAIWGGTYIANYNLENIQKSKYKFTELKSTYKDFDVNNLLDFKEVPFGNKGPLYVTPIYSPHEYKLAGEGECLKFGNPPPEIENVFMGAYFFHKGKWSASFVDGIYGRNREKFFEKGTEGVDFISSLIFNKRETSKYKYISTDPIVTEFLLRKFCVLEYFIKNNEPIKEKDCGWCSPCPPLSHFFKTTSVNVELNISIEGIVQGQYSEIIKLNPLACGTITTWGEPYVEIAIGSGDSLCCTNPEISVNIGGTSGLCGFGYFKSGGATVGPTLPISVTFPFIVTGCDAFTNECRDCLSGTATVNIS